MMQNNQRTIMPLQPYLILQTNTYKRMEDLDLGISHYYEFTLEEGNQHSIYSVPDGSIDLLFNIGTNQVHTYLSGTVFRAKPWEMGEDTTCFGVRLQAGEGILPKEISMDMLVDQDLKIEGNLFGDHLAERIALAKNMQERVTIFKDAYQKLMKKNEDISLKQNIDAYVRNRICERKGNVSIEDLAAETGYSPCYVRRIFKQFHGISPKQFSQFIRFQNLLQIIKENKNPYEQIALECGYYDEPHMMKDFKCYTGVTLEHYSSMIEEKKNLI